MAQPVVIADDTRFQVKYDQQELLGKVKPFIESIWQSLASRRALDESVLAAADAYPEAARYFVINPGHIGDSFSLRAAFLFGDWKIQSLQASTPAFSCEIDLAQSPLRQHEIMRMMELCSSGAYDQDAIRARLGDYAKPHFESMLSRGFLTTGKREDPFGSANRPGVFRLQHAALLYRSTHAGVLVDPHFHSIYRPEIETDLHRDQLEGKVDAILISHFHEDHWFLSTLMSFSRDMPIVVPRVPRSTIICGDMEKMLRNLGFRNVIAVDWYADPLIFGDLEVHVLPFFGEQPLRFEHCKDTSIRNWGNTYVIRTRNYTSWFLIDSGADALGSMTEVAEHVHSRLGPVDFVLSNLRRFHVQGYFYINGGLNWLALSPSQLLNFEAMRNDCITLGPQGVAEVCKIVDATYYLPYAHWWGDVGAVGGNRINIPGENEGELLAELRSALSNLRAGTRIVEWNIGDQFVALPNGDGFRRHVSQSL
jgi:L-ascorbate metabolism protein UlaG (beta-lactamase superfamily)